MQRIFEYLQQHITTASLLASLDTTHFIIFFPSYSILQTQEKTESLLKELQKIFKDMPMSMTWFVHEQLLSDIAFCKQECFSSKDHIIDSDRFLS